LANAAGDSAVKDTEIVKAQLLSDVAIKQLSVAERLDLISTLWDSIPDSLDELSIPESHREGLECRLTAADADPDGAIPWKEVRQCCERRIEPAHSYWGLNLLSA
jgi:putative addiction module component (TIGR02574 family)